MTTFGFAEMPEWAAKVDKIQDAVVSQATANMLADIDVRAGINRGGSRERGVIPRDLGALARSLQSTLYGSTSFSAGGEDSHALIAGKMKAGDSARYSWGGAAAPYAEAVHYGANGVAGTFWIDVAAGKWQSHVARAAAIAKVKIT